MMEGSFCLKVTCTIIVILHNVMSMFMHLTVAFIPTNFHLSYREKCHAFPGNQINAQGIARHHTLMFDMELIWIGKYLAGQHNNNNNNQQLIGRFVPSVYSIESEAYSIFNITFNVFGKFV